MWGISSDGRMLALHARGQGFNPPILHHKNLLIVMLWKGKRDMIERNMALHPPSL